MFIDVLVRDNIESRFWITLFFFTKCHLTKDVYDAFDYINLLYVYFGG